MLAYGVLVAKVSRPGEAVILMRLEVDPRPSCLNKRPTEGAHQHSTGRTNKVVTNSEISDLTTTPAGKHTHYNMLPNSNFVHS